MKVQYFCKKKIKTVQWIKCNKPKTASRAVPFMFDVVYTANTSNFHKFCPKSDVVLTRSFFKENN